LRPSSELKPIRDSKQECSKIEQDEINAAKLDQIVVSTSSLAVAGAVRRKKVNNNRRL
jgi:hypothetical protein